MRVAPGAQPAPQSGPEGAPQSPQGQPQGAQGVSPGQAIQMIEQGFLALGKFMQSGGSQLPPDDIKLFQQAAQATDAMIQSLSGPSQQGQGPQASQAKAPGGPMPQNASANSQASGPQG